MLDGRCSQRMFRNSVIPARNPLLGQASSARHRTASCSSSPRLHRLLHSDMDALRVDGDALVVSSHVAHLRGGILAMPSDTTSVLIEVGASDLNTMDEQELQYYPRSFLVSFEPLLDKYALLLAKGHRIFAGHRQDVGGIPLGHHHPRGVALPLAISPHGGSINFTVSRVAGCSSMVRIDPTSTFANTACKSSVEVRRVPSITLEAALRLTGKLPILRLKIDAQVPPLKLPRIASVVDFRLIGRLTALRRASTSGWYEKRHLTSSARALRSWSSRRCVPIAGRSMRASLWPPRSTPTWILSDTCRTAPQTRAAAASARYPSTETPRSRSRGRLPELRALSFPATPPHAG